MSLGMEIRSLSAKPVNGQEELVARILDTPLDQNEFFELGLGKYVRHIGVTEQFEDVISHFGEGCNTPAGFKRELKLGPEGLLQVDLVRNISYDKNGIKRPTGVLFSADSANPYEVAPIKDLIANLTCNPGIVYDLFINNPKANVGGKYKTRDEVMEEIGRILGPGCDISVELNNPFEKSMEAILEEAEKFREMFSKYRVVIKVPHTGPVNAENVNELLEGGKKFSGRYYEPTTEDAFRGHRLALMLHEKGYRVNFTLMFEPYQTRLALQARPYFINSFVRHRLSLSEQIAALLGSYKASGDEAYLEKLKTVLVDKDVICPGDCNISLTKVEKMGKEMLTYRRYEDKEGLDGLDGVRHNLRVLRDCNMADTRLIICSMEGEKNYPDIDRLLSEPEFAGVQDKVVITAEPSYLARFTSTPQVISYQRRFMNAAKGQK